MKFPKVLGVVLSLHFGVIAMLVVQSGCSTATPPTKTFEQTRTTDLGPAGEATESADGAIDDAFNAGIGGDRFAPQRPTNEFAEFDDLEPLEPLGSMTPVAPTVDIAEPSFQTYTVQKGDSLWKISRVHSVSVNELYSANGLSKDSILKIGQEIKIPVDGGSATVSTVTADVYQPTALTSGSTNYTVVSGDTLSKIAKQHNTTVRAIKAANNKTSDIIRIGEQLVIPSADTAAPVAAASSTTVSAAATAGAAGTHTVQAGEYPGKIASMYGITTQELLSMNAITDPRSLQIGQVLKVGSGAPQNVAAVIETAPAVETTTAAPVSVAPAPASAPVVSSEPTQMRIIEAQPVAELEVVEVANPDAVFENAQSIPVFPAE